MHISRKAASVILILYLSDIIIDLITYKQTAKTEELKRRITFNPLKHFSIFGIIMLLIVGIIPHQFPRKK